MLRTTGSTMLRRSVLQASRASPAPMACRAASTRALSKPMLANIEKRWEGMPLQEQAELWMALRDRMKENWAELSLQEKKAGKSIDRLKLPAQPGGWLFHVGDGCGSRPSALAPLTVHGGWGTEGAARWECTCSVRQRVAHDIYTHCHLLAPTHNTYPSDSQPVCPGI